MPTYLDDGNWYAIERWDGGHEPCVVLQLTSLDVWLSPDEARALAAALMDAAQQEAELALDDRWVSPDVRPVR